MTSEARSKAPKASCSWGMDGCATVSCSTPQYATPDVDSFIERFADAYRSEVADFVDAIRQQRPPRVGGEDALEALRLAMAADRSLRERRPIRVADVRDD